MAATSKLCVSAFVSRTVERMWTHGPNAMGDGGGSALARLNYATWGLSRDAREVAHWLRTGLTAQSAN